MTEDLIAFIRAQLDDDERVARQANPGPWRRFTDREHLDPLTIFGGRYMGDQEKLRNVASLEYSWVKDGNAEHITRWDPARVLAEIEAKRRILDEHAHYPVGIGLGCGICSVDPHMNCETDEGWCTTVRLLALPYADREGYREEWRA